MNKRTNEEIRQNAQMLYHEASYAQHLKVVDQMQKDGYFQAAASSIKQWEELKRDHARISDLGSILGTIWDQVSKAGR